MMKPLLNSVIAKYRDFLMSLQIIDLLATDKSQYFAQPRPIIVNWLNYPLSLVDISIIYNYFGVRFMSLNKK